MQNIASFLVSMKQSPTKELQHFFLSYDLDLRLESHENWIPKIKALGIPQKIKVEGYHTQGGTRFEIKLGDLPKDTEKIVIFV